MSDKIEIEYTEREALDEAVRLFTRRLRRLHTDAYNSVIMSLPAGVWKALNAADIRADVLRSQDVASADMIRTWPNDDIEDDEHNGTDDTECTECGHFGNGQVPGCKCEGCDD